MRNTCSNYLAFLIFAATKKFLEIAQELLNNLMLVIISRLLVYIGQQRLSGNLSGMFYNCDRSQCL